MRKDSGARAICNLSTWNQGVKLVADTPKIDGAENDESPKIHASFVGELLNDLSTVKSFLRSQKMFSMLAKQVPHL